MIISFVEQCIFKSYARSDPWAEWLKLFSGIKRHSSFLLNKKSSKTEGNVRHRCGERLYFAGIDFASHSKISISLFCSSIRRMIFGGGEMLFNVGEFFTLYGQTVIKIIWLNGHEYRRLHFHRRISIGEYFDSFFPHIFPLHLQNLVRTANFISQKLNVCKVEFKMCDD